MEKEASHHSNKSVSVSASPSKIAGTSTSTKPDFVVAIDFGTAFTGVAYVLTAAFGNNPVTLPEVAQNISVLERWPNSNIQGVTRKIPTVLAYDSAGSVAGWGAIRRSNRPQIKIEYFKLGLDQGHYGQTGDNSTDASSVLGKFLTNPNWTHPRLPNKTAIDFTIEFLSKLHKYFFEDYLPTQYSPLFLQGHKLGVVMTVPAVWRERAKNLLRQAGVRAGIEESSLVIVTEPEAAALYCATICPEVGLGVGDAFIVCDAGGGTVDLISYKIESTNPFKFQEYTQGAGGTCGSIFLGQNFVGAFLKKLEKWSLKEQYLNSELIEKALNSFDEDLKCSFDPDSDDEPYGVYLGRVPDDDAINIRDGYLNFTSSEMQQVFIPIFKRILGFVQQQLDGVRAVDGVTKVKAVFLVGGLGSNTYLRKFLIQRLPSEISVKQPAAAQTAVLRGAVLHRLGYEVVARRILRASYGIDQVIPFEPGVHPISLMTQCPDGTLGCKGVMHWFVKKGESITSNFVVRHTATSHLTEWKFKYAESLNCAIELMCCTEDNTPEYMDSCAAKLLGLANP